LLIFKKSSSVFLIAIIIISFVPNVNAVPSINIFTEKKVYSYGDTLSFTIEVSEITGEPLILHIIDESGKRSSAIPMTITDLKTVVPSPYPFEATVYPQGKYTLQIEYSGAEDTVEFELNDSGNIVIPLWIKEISKYWYNGAISDIEFADGIGFLIKEEIIIVPQTESQTTTNEVTIPDWVKKSTGWWIDGIVSDREYAAALEYLIKAGIIVV
jgi:hypothetical protein